MQPNTITLAVDVLNNGTSEDKVYTRFEEYLNRSVYIGTNHVLHAKDTVTLYRTPQKPSGNFLGVGKTAFKFSRDITVLGADGSSVVAPIIFEVSCSIPVGATAADILVERQKVIALCDRDDIMVSFNNLLMI